MNHEKLYSQHKKDSAMVEQVADLDQSSVLFSLKKALVQKTYDTNLKRAKLAVKSAESEAHEEKNARDKSEEQDLIAASWNRGPLAADKLTDGISKSGADSAQAIDALFERAAAQDEKHALPAYMTYQGDSLVINGVYTDTEYPGYIGAKGMSFLISGVRQTVISKSDAGYSVEIYETQRTNGKQPTRVERKFSGDLHHALVRNRNFADYARYAAMLDQQSITLIGEPVLTKEITYSHADKGWDFDLKIHPILHGKAPRKYKGGHQDLNTGILE